MKLHSIETGFFKLDGGAMFGVVPKSIWNKLNPADENNLCTWSMRLLLIEHGDRLILVDTGIGNKQDQKFFSHYHLHGEASLEKSLAANGFQKKDITDVILTHLHFDHCGGAIEIIADKLVPAFPQATYWSSEQHWKWAISPNDREKASFLKENILPIKESGQLKFVENWLDLHETSAETVLPAGGRETLKTVPFLDQICLRYAYGHTDAMILPQLTYQGRTLVFVADLLPSTGHLPIPYVMAYDMFPLTTIQEKKSFLTEAAQKDYILFFEHDPNHECCSLQITEKGVRIKETFRLAELS